MYFYFTSSFPAVLKINGIVFGEITNQIKFINIDGDLPLIEVCPLIPTENYRAFFLNDNFLSTPPEYLSITDLQGGYLIKVYSQFLSPTLKVLQQKKFFNITCTIYNENGYKLSIESQNDFFIDNIYFEFNSSKIDYVNINGCNFICIYFSGEKNYLFLYSVDNKIECKFNKEVFSYEINQNFSTFEKFSDIAKHSVKTFYTFNNNEFIQQKREIFYSDSYTKETLNEKIIPYAFLEEFFIGGDYEFFLSDKIKENKDSLFSFFGNFIGVCPPPLFRNYDEIGLIYKESYNKYKVNYFTFTLENGKISNLVKS
ncbi:MAG: hypothetical protein MJ066_03365 [Clostridia bacterium]|nr:hypothetical protein [Clostridia bacterium]